MRFRSSDLWVVEKQEEKAEEDTGFCKLEVTGCHSQLVVVVVGVTEPFLEIGGKYFLPSNGCVDEVCLGVSSWVLKPMQGPMNSHFCSGETLYLMKILGEDALHIGQSGVTSGVFAWSGLGPFSCTSVCPGTTVA